MIRSWIVLLLFGFVLSGGCVSTRKAAGPEKSGLQPGVVFQDCDECPQMVVVPAGSFEMGSNLHDLERPVHTVTLAKPFAVGTCEVTFEEWDACVADGGCRGYRADDEGWGRGRQPAINVSWRDAWSYVWWLRKKTGRKYRLPSEAEWEYVAKAGPQTQFWWGLDTGVGNANCNGCGSEWDYKRTAPVGMFDPNGFGLYDTAGNVWEWVEDCSPDLGRISQVRAPAYRWAPSDGTAVVEGASCHLRVVRGGSWRDRPWHVRPANRNYIAKGLRDRSIGFRVARDLD